MVIARTKMIPLLRDLWTKDDRWREGERKKESRLVERRRSMIGYRWSGGTGRSESEKEKQGERRTWVSSLSCELDFTRFWPPQSRVRTRRGRGVSSTCEIPLQLTRGSKYDFKRSWTSERCGCVSDFSLPCVAVFCVLVNFFFFPSYSFSRFLSRFLYILYFIYIFYIYKYIYIYIFTLLRIRRLMLPINCESLVTPGQDYT